ncbi:hypothetical protein [Desulfosporosinus acidiphilus]|uniref:hypothetical protein n=1 Tax=Desulfosporosinus acidiphilus TaxID=885581 RepID=UPI000257ADA9|nr:hypothetical protein [Desulfosporosinus acidiphilus]
MTIQQSLNCLRYIPASLETQITSGTLTDEMTEFLNSYVKKGRTNIIVSGPTALGMTTGFRLKIGDSSLCSVKARPSG